MTHATGKEAGPMLSEEDKDDLYDAIVHPD